MTTEAEALNKWCPFTQVPDTLLDVNDMPIAAVSFNRYSKGPIPEGSKCIGSRCMMWRWTTVDMIHGYCGLVPGYNPVALSP